MARVGEYLFPIIYQDDLSPTIKSKWKLSFLQKDKKKRVLIYSESKTLIGCIFKIRILQTRRFMNRGRNGE